MYNILYNFDGKNAYCLLVKGIDPDLKSVKQKFHVVNGAWSGYYCNGVVTYPKGDWRHGTNRIMELHNKIDYVEDYNETIYRFERDELGLYKGGVDYLQAK
jgi:hypothetical protein